LLEATACVKDGISSGEKSRGCAAERLHKGRRSSRRRLVVQYQFFGIANGDRPLRYVGAEQQHPNHILPLPSGNLIESHLDMARKYLGGSGERLTVWISIAASTVLIFYGYDQGVFGNVIISENFLHTFGYPSANMQGVMTSIYNIGCFIGAMSTIWTGDILGRPRQIILGSTIIGIGAIIQTCSWTVASMMVGRIVAGLGTGMNTATAGVWQAETSKMNSRGKLVIIQMGESQACTSQLIADNSQRTASPVSLSRIGSHSDFRSHLVTLRGAFLSHSNYSLPFASTLCAHSCPTHHVFSSAKASTTKRSKSWPHWRAMARLRNLRRLLPSTKSSRIFSIAST